ncbi:MAG: arginine--tRNA ligase [Flavobacteriaceae bacterium TMED68]|nr:MAG: arginine--tRNA ligase [Flavobacteriaceae bacterium TMED68]|tara:strand:+ start:25682 stop:27466 length:1785 start_codon:yes stop_codon:yes gene_type:complete
MSTNYNTHFSNSLKTFFKSKYDLEINTFDFQNTRKEFKGNVTLLVFPILKYLKIDAEKLAKLIGEYLIENNKNVESFNVVKGFLNLSLSDAFFFDRFSAIYEDKNFGHKILNKNSPKVMVEFSSPNTNKPLHLGHIRNNLLGYSISKILEADGKKVIKTQIINDRGIHICKSMIAWIKYGKGDTPKKSGIKGDQLVGKYYVIFELEYKKQIASLISKGKSIKEAEKIAPIILEAQEMLRLWESKDSKVILLWKKMNRWVYDGFEKTYKKLGVDFDSYYYESKTYLVGKEIVEKGLKKGLFFKKNDGSVWIDLSDEGLGEKLLLRSDGTSVYITQDLGTALLRMEKNPELNGLVFTVGNEQDYHFKVLFAIIKKLGFNWSSSLYHLSYGMVDLPSGKMKSREGTVVDADNLIDEMTKKAKSIAKSVGKLETLKKSERENLYNIIGLGALKYFILKVDPKKRILFDPEASIDFNGNTGPFIQYTYARIKSLIKNIKDHSTLDRISYSLDEKERKLVTHLSHYPSIISQAAEQYSPAIIANYLYELVKNYNTFYQNIKVLGVNDPYKKQFRIALSRKVGQVIKRASSLLGINLPETM